MIDIYEEVRVLLLRKGLSMRKVARILRENGHTKIPVEGGLSNKFNKKTIRFDEVQKILDFLGYEIEIKEK